MKYDLCSALAAMAFLILPAGASAATETVLHSFAGSLGNAPGGSVPEGTLMIDASGALYGTTSQGGTASVGVIFKLTPPGAGHTVWGETVLYNFTGVPDFTTTYGLISDPSGVLYGATYLGGTVCPTPILGRLGCGTLFELIPPSAGHTVWTEKVIHRFTGTDGSLPGSKPIRDSAGALYGTTNAGGDANGDGVVFKLTPPGPGHTVWTETVLHRFTGADGANPEADLLMGSDGALYGTTSQGGSSTTCGIDCRGVVFKLTPPGGGHTEWSADVLHRFTGPDGKDPEAGLIEGANGVLYGTTSGGGSGCLNVGCGVVFELVPPKPGHTVWGYRILHFFAGGADGAGPAFDLLRDPHGVLYGVTQWGGASSAVCGGPTGCGTAFALTPKAGGVWTETALHRFANQHDGGYPAGLIEDANGRLYGATGGGGNGRGGTVFELVP